MRACNPITTAYLSNKFSFQGQSFPHTTMYSFDRNLSHCKLSLFCFIFWFCFSSFTSDERHTGKSIHKTSLKFHQHVNERRALHSNFFFVSVLVFFISPIIFLWYRRSLSQKNVANPFIFFYLIKERPETSLLVNKILFRREFIIPHKTNTRHLSFHLMKDFKILLLSTAAEFLLFSSFFSYEFVAETFLLWLPTQMRGDDML